MLMFNPTNLDEVCVHVTHIEFKWKFVHGFSLAESNQSKDGKKKRKGRHTTTMRKGDENPTYSHCQK